MCQSVNQGSTADGVVGRGRGADGTPYTFYAGMGSLGPLFQLMDASPVVWKGHTTLAVHTSLITSVFVSVYQVSWRGLPLKSWNPASYAQTWLGKLQYRQQTCIASSKDETEKNIFSYCSDACTLALFLVVIIFHSHCSLLIAEGRRSRDDAPVQLCLLLLSSK